MCFGTTTIPAHQSVGLSTLVITPMSSILVSVILALVLEQSLINRCIVICYIILCYISPVTEVCALQLQCVYVLIEFSFQNQYILLVYILFSVSVSGLSFVMASDSVQTQWCFLQCYGHHLSQCPVFIRFSLNTTFSSGICFVDIPVCYCHFDDMQFYLSLLWVTIYPCLSSSLGPLW